MTASGSIVVLNWNGGEMVMECLNSALAQDAEDMEVIVVDNGSSDGSLEAIKQARPNVRTVELGRNTGYSAGMNAGIDATSGELILLLNLDITLDPNYMADCKKAFEDDPELGGVTGKLLKPGDAHPPIIDTTGHIVYRNRRAVDRGEWEADSGQYDDKTDLFGICGAAPVLSRKMLNDIKSDGQYFDEDFFSYFEDFDLSWRARSRGWRFSYVPSATARHIRGGTGGKSSSYVLSCNHRNRLFVMVKNDHWRSFLRHLPGIVYTEIRAILHMLWISPTALLRAWVDFFRYLPRMRRKRKLISSSATVDWRELEPWFEKYDYQITAIFRRARMRTRQQ